MSPTRNHSESSSSGFQVIFERPDQPVTSPTAGEHALRPRRYHTKSRNGCFNCKKRRIKCSEARPECSHCVEKGLSCEYPPAKVSSPSIRSGSTSSPSRQASLSSQSSRSSEYNPWVAAILDEDDVPGDALAQQGYTRQDVYDLLHHFVQRTTQHWIGSPLLSILIQDLLRREAGKAPYLLYSALAFSAAHMQHLDPANTKYSAAAPYHYQQSLRQYFEKLNGPLDSDDSEALFASCKLHSFLAFWNASPTHEGSPGIDLGWVRSMRGIRFIMQSPQLMTSLQRGDFSAIIGDSGQSWHAICGAFNFESGARVTVDLQRLHALERLCAGLAEEYRSTCLQTIRTIRDLAQARPEPASIPLFTNWIYRLSQNFMDILEAAEPVALLTMAVWCALFSRVQEWWIVAPAKRECRKVCEHVSALGDSKFDPVLAYLRTFS